MSGARSRRKGRAAEVVSSEVLIAFIAENYATKGGTFVANHLGITRNELASITKHLGIAGNRSHAYKNGRSVGGSECPTAKSYNMMRQRCENPNNTKWRHYGGRGITVCEEWKTYEGFLRDMGERPPGTSLDRIDPDGNYEPSNCRWASASVQSVNRRGRYEIDGKSLTARRACEIYGAEGVTHRVLSRRVNRYRWSVMRALTTPLLPTGRQPKERK